MSRNAKIALVLALLVIGIAGFATCAQLRGSTSGSSNLKVLERRSPKEIEPFTHAQLPSIIGNSMHETHFATEVKCGVCHLSNEPLPPDRAQEVCNSCHEQKKVAKRVWTSHCLACHYFTEGVKNAARNPGELTKALCLKCHQEQDTEGGHLYARCSDKTDEMVHCEHCHRPHDSAAPAAIELCVQCHTDLKDSRHPRGTDAKCSLCHRPHSPTLNGAKICISCHGQAEHVIIHRIEAHPKDCLVCHKAHFTTIEIKGACQNCHEGRVYRAGPYTPAAHEDCENCHNLANFKFKGTADCVECHKHQGAILRDKSAPLEHKRCLTCHPQHTWRATYASNCRDCHDLSKVFEHTVPYHPKDCSKCHDPHQPTKMPKSGDCDGCHMKLGNVPPFGTGGPEEHRTCENCHQPDQIPQRKFVFVGPEASCRICHTEARAGMDWSKAPPPHTECINCHQPHTFRVADQASSCEICHADQVEQMPTVNHRQCLNCHAADHSFAFLGAQYSCQLCHPDALADVPSEMHQDCSNCHAMDHSVKFVGVSASCAVCHGTPPELHAGKGHQDCMNCHAQHTFKADNSLCGVCHGDKASGHYTDNECTACHFFKADHGPAPVPVPAPVAPASGAEAGK